MNRDDLLKHVSIAMDVAKDDLLKRGRVLPLLVMTFPDRPTIMAPVPEKKIIPSILMKERPEAFTYAVEIWVRDSEGQETRDAIQVIGGTGPIRVMATLEFQKKDKIVFDKVRWLSDFARSSIVACLTMLWGRFWTYGLLLPLEVGSIMLPVVVSRFGFLRDGEWVGSKIRSNLEERGRLGGVLGTLMGPSESLDITGTRRRVFLTLYARLESRHKRGESHLQKTSRLKSTPSTLLSLGTRESNIRMEPS